MLTYHSRNFVGATFFWLVRLQNNLAEQVTNQCLFSVIPCRTRTDYGLEAIVIAQCQTLSMETNLPSVEVISMVHRP